MFSSINYLFLLSLGFISWLILCYFKEIERHFLCKANISENKLNQLVPPSKMNEENVAATPTPTKQFLPSEIQHPDSEALMTRVNFAEIEYFLYLIICIYAMVKIIQISENYIAKRLHEKFYRKKHFKSKAKILIFKPENKDLTNSEYKTSINSENTSKHQVDEEKLTQCNTEIPKLEINKNSQDFKTLESNCKTSTSTKTNSSNSKNVFITNRIIQLNNNQMFVSENMSFHQHRASKDESNILASKSNSPTDTWQKYLYMQKIAQKKELITKLSNEILLSDYCQPVVLPKTDV